MPLNIQGLDKRPTLEQKQYHREKFYMSFQLWFIYFDSLFARSTLRTTKTANQIFKFYREDTKQWTKLQNLPQLTQSYQFMQNFYRNIKNWVSSNCILAQIQAIQSRLNEIFLMMQIEKKYARDLWDSSPRRIQASVCHLYMFFQSTIEALLPDNQYNIKQYQKRYHLVTRLNFLEELVNQLLSGIEKIYKFMVGPFFKEQRKLTVQFFNHVNHLFLHLPQLHKNDFREVPKLLEYLKINNPIQISNQFIEEKNSLERGRRATVAHKPKKRVAISPNLAYPFERRKLYKQFNGCVYVITKRSISQLVHRPVCDKQSPNKKVDFQPQKIFSFPKYIYNYSLSFQKQLCSVLQRKRSKSLTSRDKNSHFSFGKKFKKKPEEKETCDNSGKRKKNQQFKTRKYRNSIMKVEQKKKNQRTNRFQSGTMRNIDAIQNKLTKSLQKERRINLFREQNVIGQKQEKQDEDLGTKLY